MRWLRLRSEQSISPELYKWLEDWQWFSAGGIPLPSKEVLEEMKQYRPNSSVQLHRIQKKDQVERKPLESWTYNLEMLETMKDMDIEDEMFRDTEIISAIVSPAEIYIDYTLLPSDVLDDFVMEEVIVKGAG